MLELSQILDFYPENLHPFRRSLLREYLQYKILEAIFESPLAPRLAFMGGTCIHILHGLPRFSEDLDFDNINLSKDDFQKLARIVATAFKREGYSVELKTTDKEAFHAYFRFENILYESGLSGQEEEKLLIQADTMPQNFYYNPEKPILNKFDLFLRINAVPADILLAQKLYCILNRKRAKGRDFFDVTFLLGKTSPNMGYLKTKLNVESAEEVKVQLLKRCGQLDFSTLAKVVEPFVYKKHDVEKVLLFTQYIKEVF